MNWSGEGVMWTTVPKAPLTRPTETSMFFLSMSLESVPMLSDFDKQELHTFL